MRDVPVAFTGSPGELRRHSRRDLLWNILLGGLYTSIARRHVAQYLATHTAIDGTLLQLQPVRKSRWPAILLASLFIALRLASEFGMGPPMPLVIAVGVLLVPHVWGIVTARTLDALQWRGLRLSFEASWPQVYGASWPLLLLGAAWAWAEPQLAGIAPDAAAADARWIAGAAATAALLLPLLAAQGFLWRRLRITRTRVGGMAVRWPGRFGSHLRLWLETAVGLVVVAIAPVLIVRRLLLGSLSLEGLPLAEAASVYLLALVAMLVLSTPVRAWHEARSFVLAWHGVELADGTRVDCALDVRSFVAMRTRDQWRSCLTLGRQHAEGVVRAYRMKLAGLRLRAAGKGRSASGSDAVGACPAPLTPP